MDGLNERALGVIREVSGLNRTELKMVLVLLKFPALTIRKLSKSAGVERSTAQKIVKVLLASKHIVRKQVNLDEGGYFYDYSVREPDLFRKRIKEAFVSENQLILKEIESELSS